MEMFARQARESCEQFLHTMYTKDGRKLEISGEIIKELLQVFDSGQKDPSLFLSARDRAMAHQVDQEYAKV